MYNVPYIFNKYGTVPHILKLIFGLDTKTVKVCTMFIYVEDKMGQQILSTASALFVLEMSERKKIKWVKKSHGFLC
jgi:hypothetical protein